MVFFPLPNYDLNKWELLREQIEETKQNSIEQIKEFLISIGDLSGDLSPSFKYFLTVYDEKHLLELFSRVKEFSLRLTDLFPSGKILRLGKTTAELKFTREQILCILCHMCLSSLSKTKHNMYWVNFDKWLLDGQVCACAYLHALFEYFSQSFELIDKKSEFMKENVTFERRSLDRELLETRLQHDDDLKLSKVNVRRGSIGDGSLVEVDFANQDIGFGVTGTQEEILFGSSPEMCIAMLFCDTLDGDEAIVIKGARRVALFDGYGLNVSFKECIPLETKKWSDRLVIAIDSLDFSDCERSEQAFTRQLEEANLNRELSKAFVGFSVVHNHFIDTGHWGCGAFFGSKQLKAVIQWLAASASRNSLNFYCFSENEFRQEFQHFLNEIHQKEIKPSRLLSVVRSLDVTSETSVFDTILKKL